MWQLSLEETTDKGRIAYCQKNISQLQSKISRVKFLCIIFYLYVMIFWFEIVYSLKLETKNIITATI